MSVSADMLGVLAIRGAALPARRRRRGVSGARTDHVGHRPRTNKGIGAEAARDRILAALEAGLGLDLARAVARGLTEGAVTGDERVMAAVEGWMHLPRRGVGLDEGRGCSGPEPRGWG